MNHARRACSGENPDGISIARTGAKHKAEALWARLLVRKTL